MSGETKKRKEALAAIIDGIDMLVGLDKEEKREVDRGQAPADSFGGILQSMIPLMILPQILPLFQQAFGQTLRETTVNVRVESATSIIPIDVTAQTAILAVDIRAQTVTLNIRIIESATTLNVQITGQTTTLNVSIQGNANIVITGQTVGVSLQGTYRTINAEEVNLLGFAYVEPFGEGTIITFSPIGSEKYLIEGFTASYTILRDTILKPELIIVVLQVGVDEFAWLNLTSEKPSDTLTLIRAIAVTASYPLSVIVKNRSPFTVATDMAVFMYRVA